jgi:hypothetical protein
MLKKIVLAFTLMAAACAGAQSTDHAGHAARTGLAADLGTTALGLSMGAAEANPLGLAIVPLKFMAIAHIDQIADQHVRREQLAQFTGAQFGAAAANICTLAAGNPAVGAVCFAVAAAYGYQQVRSVPTTEEQCVQRHLPMFEAGVATGRVYKVELKTCTGSFQPARYAVRGAREDLHGRAGLVAAH